MGSSRFVPELAMIMSPVWRRAYKRRSERPIFLVSSSQLTERRQSPEDAAACSTCFSGRASPADGYGRSRPEFYQPGRRACLPPRPAGLMAV